MSKEKSEYENFNQTMQRLISVPHSEIKAKLDAEKLEKQSKKHGKKKPK